LRECETALGDMDSQRRGLHHLNTTTGNPHEPTANTMSNILLMGVSGSGKTLIGQLLAERLQFDFIEGDHYHSAENVALMRSGTPLGDQQRLTWLETLADKLSKNHQAILACSALKDRYRKLLLRECESCQIVWLHASTAVLQQRIHNRDNHFFPPQLLSSQLDTLEPPEDAIMVDSNTEPYLIVGEILQQISA